MKTPDPASVVTDYFSRARAGDVSIVDLFHDDATLIGLGKTTTGRDAIREFYNGVIERAGPSPTLGGPLLTQGNRVAAEIIIKLSGGAVVHAVDLFEVEDGRIRSLTYFICSHSS
jgi:hypothetical protein